MAFNPKGGVKVVSEEEIKRILENAIKTTPVEAVANRAPTKPMPRDIPTFESMTKTEIETWSLEHLGVDLDRRLTKRNMIDELKKFL